MSHQLTVSHQRAFSLPITTTACSSTTESNLRIRSSTQLIETPSNALLSTASSSSVIASSANSNNNNQNNLNNIHNYLSAASTFVTKSNHINCFHQRTRSLPLTEEETIVETTFNQLPSVSSSSSSSLLHSYDDKTNQMLIAGSKPNSLYRLGSSTNNSCLSSMSSMHSSNSSITANGADLGSGGGSSILRKLCENMCTQKNPDGSRRHQSKCCFYHLDIVAQKTPTNAVAKKERNNKNHHFHSKSTINHNKQSDNFSNTLPPPQNNASNNHHLSTGNSNHIHSHLDAANDSAYLLMTSSTPATGNGNRKGMNNSMDCIDENYILAIESALNLDVNNAQQQQQQHNHHYQQQQQSQYTTTNAFNTKTNNKYGVIATKSIPTILINNSTTTTVGRTISKITHSTSLSSTSSSGTDHIKHCTNSLAILSSTHTTKQSSSAKGINNGLQLIIFKQNQTKKKQINFSPSNLPLSNIITNNNKKNIIFICHLLHLLGYYIDT